GALAWNTARVARHSVVLQVLLRRLVLPYHYRRVRRLLDRRRAAAEEFVRDHPALVAYLRRSGQQCCTDQDLS
ncbi:MAG: hypothetical protein M0000_08980, partial [Actinomycetota bacterium]|nr:hypothetical protein [Actinomycetota bacterium]